MIWFAAINIHNHDLYFQIRDMELQCRGNEISGVVRGIVGDGAQEFLGEVFLGEREHAQLLPVYHDDSRVESFPETIDEPLLLRHLLAEVKQRVEPIGSSAAHRRAHEHYSSEGTCQMSLWNIAA